MNVAIDAAADYLTDQYSYMSIDYNSVSESFKTAFGDGAATRVQLDGNPLLEEAGLSDDDFHDISATLKAETGKICITVTQIVPSGKYFSTEYFDTDGSTKEDTDASNCD